MSRLCVCVRVLGAAAAAANVRMVMGGARGSREVQAGGARSMGSLYICVKTPARSYVHEGRHWSCMQAWASSIRFRCPAARFMSPTPQRKGGRVWLVYCVCYCHLKHAPVSSASSSMGDPPLRTEATGIAVVPWEEAPGDPRAGLLGPSEAFLDCRHRS